MFEPKRTRRYEYATDVILDVEANQCHDCALSEDGDMCWEAQGSLIFEDPISYMNELQDGSVVCYRYEALPS